MGASGSTLIPEQKPPARRDEAEYPVVDTLGISKADAEGCTWKGGSGGTSPCQLAVPQGVSASSAKLYRDQGTIRRDQCRRYAKDLDKVAKNQKAFEEVKRDLAAGLYYEEIPGSGGNCRQILYDATDLKDVTGPAQLPLDKVRYPVIRKMSDSGSYSSVTKLFIKPSIPFEVEFNGKPHKISVMTLMHPSPIRVENIQHDAMLTLGDPAEGNHDGLIILIPLVGAIMSGTSGTFIAKIAQYMSSVLRPDPVTGQFESLDIPTGNDWALSNLLPGTPQGGKTVVTNTGYYVWTGNPPLVLTPSGPEQYVPPKPWFGGFQINQPNVQSYAWMPDAGALPIRYIMLSRPVLVNSLDLQTIRMLPMTPPTEAVASIFKGSLSYRTADSCPAAEPSASGTITEGFQEHNTNYDRCDPFGPGAIPAKPPALAAGHVVGGILTVIGMALAIVGAIWLWMHPSRGAWLGRLSTFVGNIPANLGLKGKDYIPPPDPGPDQTAADAAVADDKAKKAEDEAKKAEAAAREADRKAKEEAAAATADQGTGGEGEAAEKAKAEAKAAKKAAADATVAAAAPDQTPAQAQETTAAAAEAAKEADTKAAEEAKAKDRAAAASAAKVRGAEEKAKRVEAAQKAAQQAKQEARQAQAQAQEARQEANDAAAVNAEAQAAAKEAAVETKRAAEDSEAEVESLQRAPGLIREFKRAEDIDTTLETGEAAVARIKSRLTTAQSLPASVQADQGVADAIGRLTRARDAAEKALKDSQKAADEKRPELQAQTEAAEKAAAEKAAAEKEAEKAQLIADAGQQIDRVVTEAAEATVDSDADLTKVRQRTSSLPKTSAEAKDLLTEVDAILKRMDKRAEALRDRRVELTNTGVVQPNLTKALQDIEGHQDEAKEWRREVEETIRELEKAEAKAAEERARLGTSPSGTGLIGPDAMKKAAEGVRRNKIGEDFTQTLARGEKVLKDAKEETKRKAADDTYYEKEATDRWRTILRIRLKEIQRELAEWKTKLADEQEAADKSLKRNEKEVPDKLRAIMGIRLKEIQGELAEQETKLTEAQEAANKKTAETKVSPPPRPPPRAVKEEGPTAANAPSTRAATPPAGPKRTLPIVRKTTVTTTGERKDVVDPEGRVDAFLKAVDDYAKLPLPRSVYDTAQVEKKRNVAHSIAQASSSEQLQRVKLASERFDQLQREAVRTDRVMTKLETQKAELLKTQAAIIKHTTAIKSNPPTRERPNVIANQRLEGQLNELLKTFREQIQALEAGARELPDLEKQGLLTIVHQAKTLEKVTLREQSQRLKILTAEKGWRGGQRRRPLKRKSTRRYVA